MASSNHGVQQSGRTAIKGSKNQGEQKSRRAAIETSSNHGVQQSRRAAIEGNRNRGEQQSRRAATHDSSTRMEQHSRRAALEESNNRKEQQSRRAAIEECSNRGEQQSRKAAIEENSNRIEQQSRKAETKETNLAIEAEPVLRKDTGSGETRNVSVTSDETPNLLSGLVILDSLKAIRILGKLVNLHSGRMVLVQTRAALAPAATPTERLEFENNNHIGLKSGIQLEWIVSGWLGPGSGNVLHPCGSDRLRSEMEALIPDVLTVTSFQMY